MTSVAIFGCGPSGLFAAWAAIQSGAKRITIISKKRRSELFGAQYLHMPIPGIDAESTEIEYRLVGTEENYRQRVYGDNYFGPTSVDEFAGFQEAWDIRETYNRLYDRFESYIAPVQGGLDGAGLRKMLSDPLKGYDLIFSTIPLPSICMNPSVHKFRAQRIWAIGDAPERGQHCPVPCDKNRIICNGLPQDPGEPDWYRVSNVFGHTTAEWPAWFYPNETVPAAEVRKLISTTCDCHPELRLLGRYGRWEKGILAHQSYNEVEGIML